MRSIIKKNTFEFTVNRAFDRVISECKKISRRDQDGTWITEEVKNAYTALHNKGYAHSAEAWINGELAGGLYGIRLGNVFYGESMFSKVSNASKFAFISYVEQLKKEGVQLVDCQVYTEHLQSLGARMIPRKEFIQLLNQNLVAR
jgi:leucyl/phenylalanyl-tRNA--protein transferase